MILSAGVGDHDLICQKCLKEVKTLKVCSLCKQWCCLQCFSITHEDRCRECLKPKKKEIEQ